MIPSSLNDDDHDSENAVHEEGLYEMLTSFLGDGKNDENNDHMVNNNDDNMGNYHQHNIDDKNLLKDSIKQAAKTPVFKSGASKTSKLVCILISIEIKSLFGLSYK